MRCEKCGLENASDVVICQRCDHILDLSFLGDDITNRAPPPVDDAAFGGDALILGELGDEISSFVSEETGGFLVADTAELTRAVVPAPVYIDAATEVLLEEDAVLELITGGIRTFDLTPFEQHISSFIDGQRPVARVAKLSGLSTNDVRIALALLADRQMLRRVGHAERSVVETDPLDAPTVDDMRLPGCPEPAASPLGEHPAMQESLSQLQEPTDSLNPFEAAPATTLDVTPADAPPSPHANAFANEPNALDPAATEILPAPGEAVATAPLTALPTPLPTEVLAVPAVAPAPTQQAPSPPPEPQQQQATLEPDALVQLIHADLESGNRARARMYMKLGRNTFPDDERFVALEQHLGGGGSSATPEAGGKERKEVALFQEANAAEAQGDYEGAVRLLREAIALNPNAPALHNRLGVILSTRLRRYDEATSALFRAVELDSDNPTFKNNLGKVLSRASEGAAKSRSAGRESRTFSWLKSKLKG